MKWKHICVIFVGVGVAAYLVFDGQRERVNRDQMESLRRNQANFDSNQRETGAGDLSSRSGQPLPRHLFSRMHRNANIWLVGSRDTDHDVLLPFEPGQLPDAMSEEEPLNQNPGFLGAEACRPCHRDKYESFVHTAHYRTSRVASVDEISGPFEEGSNQMTTGHPEIRFEMVQRDGTAYQEATFFDWKVEMPIHLIFGSSKIAETYAYWHGDKLFEMNITYLKELDKWINSPGYVDGDVSYERPITARCIECHVTYVDYRRKPNRFTPDSLVLGVSCERCHGPGGQHVEFHSADPTEKKARHISVPSKLSRQQQLDVCAQCHTTSKTNKSDLAFQFRPGDRLDEHYVDEEGASGPAVNTVHASNQLERLALSKCFQGSDMACVECHNPHQNERGNHGLFSQRCLTCHEPANCGMGERLGDKITDNCVDCHMPVEATANMKMSTDEGMLFPPLRDHYIRVDERASEKYIGKLEVDGNGS